MLEHIENRPAVFTPQAHEQAGHQGKMKRHMELIAVSEIGAHVARPLIGLGKKHTVPVTLIDALTNFFQVGMGFRQIFAHGAFALEQIGDRVAPEPVQSLIQPEFHDLHASHCRTLGLS